MIQSPTTEKLPQTQESTTEPVTESTIQSLTSGILIVAFGSTPRICEFVRDQRTFKSWQINYANGQQLKRNVF